MGESDSKIFFSIEYFAKKKGFKNFLVYSLDTDVKIISLYFAAYPPDIEICIKYGSGLSVAYFYPGKVIEYFQKENNLLNHEELTRYTKSFLKAFVYFGCDSNAGKSVVSS